jgi:hypothetical protein
MAALGERCHDLFESLRRSQPSPASAVEVPAENVDGFDPTPLLRDKRYFLVCINEMYLDYARLWTKKYDPVVFVLTEFSYGGAAQTVPFVVGPQLLSKWSQELPQGMLFRNTRVAGMYPYRGGRITISVVLGRVERGDVARQFLTVLDEMAASLDPSATLSAYTKVAGALVTGVEALFGLSKGTSPIAGLRTELDPAGGPPIRPQYFALLQAPNVEPNTLHVHNGRLYDNGKPYRSGAYVLYSLLGDTTRDDVDSLPFHPLWREVTKFAAVNDAAAWKTAKSAMSALYQEMALSPDLITDEVTTLTNERIATMQSLQATATAIQDLGEPEGTEKLTSIWARSSEILDM